MYSHDTEIARLAAQRAHLVKRLDLGLAKIQDALAQGQSVATWEAAWCGLLAEYERTADKLSEMGVRE